MISLALDELTLSDPAENQTTILSPLVQPTNLKELNLYDNPIATDQIEMLKQTLANGKIDFRQTNWEASRHGSRFPLGAGLCRDLTG